MNTKAEVMAVLHKVLPICSGVIAVSGSITNTLSLSYFLQKSDRTLCTRMFTTLNSFDLLVSLFDGLVVTFRHCKAPTICGDDSPVYRVTLLILDLGVDSTAFATCLLSVTRTIKLCFPFYQINKKAVGVTAVSFFFQEIVRSFVKYYFFYIDEFKQWPNAMKFDRHLMIISISVVVVINLVSSAVSAWKLLNTRNKLAPSQDNANRPAPGTNRNRRATVTILIVSILFCFFNASFCLSLYFIAWLFDPTKKPLPVVVTVLHAVALWLAVPFNSAVNPLIYFARKKDMRKSIKEIVVNTFRSSLSI